MTSRINALLFNERLKYSVRVGNPVFMGPFRFLDLFFNQTKHTFYGNFDSSNFKFTNNSYYRTPFYIEGTYSEKNNEESEVDYEIKTNFYSFFLSHALTLMVLVKNLPPVLINETSPDTYIRLMVVFFFLLRYFAIYAKKKELEEDFIETFDVKV